MKSRFAVRIEMPWSPAEKKIARVAFDSAYRRQCQAIADKAKQMFSTASSSTDLWRIHDYLSQQRRRVDETYDYRYSVLISIFARLLRQGWLKRTDLDGLREEKIQEIERWSGQ